MKKARQPWVVPVGVGMWGSKEFRKELEKVVVNWKELWEAGKGGREPMVWDAQ